MFLFSSDLLSLKEKTATMSYRSIFDLYNVFVMSVQNVEHAK